MEFYSKKDEYRHQTVKVDMKKMSAKYFRNASRPNTNEQQQNIKNFLIILGLWIKHGFIFTIKKQNTNMCIAQEHYDFQGLKNSSLKIC